MLNEGRRRCVGLFDQRVGVIRIRTLDQGRGGTESIVVLIDARVAGRTGLNRSCPNIEVALLDLRTVKRPTLGYECSHFAFGALDYRRVVIHAGLHYVHIAVRSTLLNEGRIAFAVLTDVDVRIRVSGVVADVLNNIRLVACAILLVAGSHAGSCGIWVGSNIQAALINPRTVACAVLDDPGVERISRRQGIAGWRFRFLVDRGRVAGIGTGVRAILLDASAAVVPDLVDSRIVRWNIEQVRTDRRIFSLRDFREVVIAVLINVGHAFIAGLADHGHIVVAVLQDVRILQRLRSSRTGQRKRGGRSGME